MNIELRQGISASARRWLASLMVACAITLAALGGFELTREVGRVSVIWIANGLLLGLLLISERDRFAPWLIAGMLGNVAANLLAGDSVVTALLLASCNTLEVAIAWYATRSFLNKPSDLLQMTALWRFFAGALLLAPAITAMAAASVLHLLEGAPIGPNLRVWFAADALGMAVMTPLVLALRPADWRRIAANKRWPQVVGPIALLIAVAVGVFMQSSYPFLFMLFPPLLLMSFRLGFSGAALGVFVIACVALVFTIAGSGPFTLLADETIATRVFAVQCLLATTILTSYPVCAVLARQEELLNAVAASEQHMRAIAENSNDVIILSDKDGIRRYVSPAANEILGYTPEELLGGQVGSILHREDRRKLAEAVAAVQGDQLMGTYRVRRKDGEYVWIESSARQLRDPRTGEGSGWISTIRDISARQRIDRLKDEFISTVSHELRTPLTSLLGALGLISSGIFEPGSPKVARLLEMARLNGDRLARLVNDILDFEKVASGAMRFVTSTVAVDECVNKAVLANQQYAERLGVSFRTHLDTQAFINVDPDRFEQVLSNLLSNAAKFSHRGGVVDVHTHIDEDDCIVTVRDYGIGIPAAFRDAIFDRFSQAGSSLQHERGGSGLGMAIAKHMTERMGGSLSFESEEGRGTVFYVSFPRTIAEAQAVSAS